MIQSIVNDVALRVSAPWANDGPAMPLAIASNPLQSLDIGSSLPASGGDLVGSPNDPTGGLSYGALSFLTLQAVAQTVIICLFGYFAARAKWLTPTVQKQVSMLNVQIFTPCLIFSKLASSLSLSALIDIAIIPVLFVVTTCISMLCAKLTSRVFRFNLRESNFVTAMAVFGNSNSLPVSLTVSLAYTMPMLKWPDIPNDNPDDVASRGILYLLIFQQLGQIVRWSWGYNTLLAKPAPEDDDADVDSSEVIVGKSDDETTVGVRRKGKCKMSDEDNSEDDDSEATNEGDEHYLRSGSSTSSMAPVSGYTTATAVSEAGDGEEDRFIDGEPISAEPLTTLQLVRKYLYIGYCDFISVMNPPLWAMVIAIIVASIPAAKHELFETTGFVNHAITGAVTQVGGVAIPLILVVLGSNLAPNESAAPASKNHNKIVLASLLSRMILPSMILLPIIALSVKYIKLSILDDPIFLLVAFILTVSPPAIQLSQICQLNEIFEKEMASVLFWGYVVLTLPSTIAIVVASLEVLEWADLTRA